MADLQYWEWRGHRIAYRSAGDIDNLERGAVVLIHGFGASSGHWHKNIPYLAERGRVFAKNLQSLRNLLVFPNVFASKFSALA